MRRKMAGHPFLLRPGPPYLLIIGPGFRGNPATLSVPHRASSEAACRAWQRLRLSPMPCVWFQDSRGHTGWLCRGWRVQASFVLPSRSTPAATRLTAVEWRKVCGDTRLLPSEETSLAAVATYCFNLNRTPAAPRGCPYRLTKIGWPAADGCRFRKSFNTATVSGQSGQTRSFRPLPNNRTWKGGSSRKALGERFNAS